jgi:phospholipid transport system substrate-binding protein
MRGRFLTCALAALAVSAFLAGTAAAVQPPQDLIHETSEKVLAKLRADRDELKKNPGRLYELIQELVIPHFDFERMSRLVIGKNWRTATPDQKKRFTEEFRTLLVRTYGTSLLQYTDQKIRYEPFRAGTSATDATVDTTILQAGGPPIPVQYGLSLTGSEWKVYDVVIDGVSLVINYRGSFSDQIRKGGFDSLIAQVAEKNKKGTK